MGIAWLLILGSFSLGASLEASGPDDPESLVEIQLRGLMRAYPVQLALKNPTNQHTLQENAALVLPDPGQSNRELSNGNEKVPVSYHPAVQRYIDLFLRENQAAFSAMLGMSEQLFPLIEKELQALNLPNDLKYLPVALSALNPQAESDFGAGLWQLNYFLAKRYGLEITEHLDQRLDPVLSTKAATRSLYQLKQRFGTWDKTFAAYACGPGGIAKAEKRVSQGADFWELYPSLPKIGREIVPAFIAARYCFNFQKNSGFQAIKIQELREGDVIEPEQDLDCTLLCRALDLSKEQLLAYNPLLRGDVLPAKSSNCPAYVPPGYRARFILMQDSLNRIEEEIAIEKAKQEELARIAAEKAKIPAGTAEVSYTIKSGDNLGLIASWFKVRVSTLKAWNNLNSDRIKAGEPLKVFVPKEQTGYFKNLNSMSFEEKQQSIGVTPKTSASKGTPSPTKPPKTISSKDKNTGSTPAGAGSKPSGPYTTYTVRSGDNLWTISRKYPGVSDADIRRWNGIGNDLQPGQKLKIYQPD